MNKDEIIKALFKRNDTLCKDALDLITEQEKEIKRLKAENAKLLDSVESVQAGRCCLRCELTKKAVREFAEKISNKIDRIYGKEPYKTLHYFEICDSVDSIIDELVKEYEVEE